MVAPLKSQLRTDAWAVFGRRCGVRFAEVATYGIELVAVDTVDVVIMRDAHGPACVVSYVEGGLCGIYSRDVVGELIA